MTSLNRITIPDQVGRRLTPREGFNKLLRRPNRTWMLRHIEVNHTPTIVDKNNKHEQLP